MNAYSQLALTRAVNGEISMNQAYKEYLNADGNGSFKEFITKAVNLGWVDQTLNAASSALHSKYGDGGNGLDLETPCLEGYEKNAEGICVESKKGMSTFAKVGIAVGIIALIGGIAYFAKKNK